MPWDSHAYEATPRPPAPPVGVDPRAETARMGRHDRPADREMEAAETLRRLPGLRGVPQRGAHRRRRDEIRRDARAGGQLPLRPRYEDGAVHHDDDAVASARSSGVGSGVIGWEGSARI